MGKFRFQRKYIELEIEDRKYKIEHNQEILAKKDEALKKVNAFKEKLDTQTDLPDSEVLAETQDFFRETIDLFLGEGEFDKIIEGRKYDMFEALELTVFVLNEIGAYDKRRIDGTLKRKK